MGDGKIEVADVIIDYIHDQTDVTHWYDNLHYHEGIDKYSYPNFSKEKVDVQRSSLEEEVSVSSLK